MSFIDLIYAADEDFENKCDICGDYVEVGEDGIRSPHRADHRPDPDPDGYCWECSMPLKWRGNVLGHVWNHPA